MTSEAIRPQRIVECGTTVAYTVETFNVYVQNPAQGIPVTGVIVVPGSQENPPINTNGGNPPGRSSDQMPNDLAGVYASQAALAKASYRI